MTLTSEQFRERMVDYLYEMLDGEELRAFEAHLHASADARRELAALQRTLRSAREALAHQPEDAPPARVRNAVLEAARAQAVRSRAATRPDHVGIWNRVRVAWLVPALGVAAAVSLVVFGKHVEPPVVVSSRAAPAVVPAAPSAAPPTAAGPARELARSEGETRPSPQDAARAASGVARVRAPQPGFAVPPPAWAAKREAIAPRGRAAEPPPEPEPEAVASAADKVSAQPSARRAGATSGSRAASESADSLGSVEVPAPAKPSAVAAAPSLADDARSESGAVTSSRVDPTSQSALVRRAHEHIVAKRWREAEADYRELLRRYPNDARAASWKKQLERVINASHDAERETR